MTIDFAQYWWAYLLAALVCGFIASIYAGRATDQLVPRPKRSTSLSAFFIFSYLSIEIARGIVS